jgi:hypothetical protein
MEILQGLCSGIALGGIYGRAYTTADNDTADWSSQRSLLQSQEHRIGTD